MTLTLTRPLVAATAAEQRDTVYDLAAGRCAVEAVLAPFGVPAWRARLRPITVRLVESASGTQRLEAQLMTRPRFASLPLSTSWFMPATPRSARLGFAAELVRLDVGGTTECDGVVTCGDREWPIELQLRCVEADGTRVVMSVRGIVARRDQLPFQSVPLRLDAALELVRCD